MHAAVVTRFDQPPRYTEHDEPVAGTDEVIVDVLGAGLHRLVRGQASGAHYSSSGRLPLVPGMDGVVRDGDGNLRYAVLGGQDLGTFAERTAIDPRRSILLPPDADPVRIAAAMNPAMSSWVALRRRIDFRPGQSVLVLGATGSSGRLAVQIAKLLGAGRVVAAGRDEERLAAVRELGADDLVTLDDAGPAADVDVVLDYVWGEPSAQAMQTMITKRADRRAPLDWVQIGSVAGQTLPLQSALLRSSRLRLCGSGIGSNSAQDLLAELPAIAAAVQAGDLDVRARAVPLSRVSEEWNTESRDRIVFVP